MDYMLSDHPKVINWLPIFWVTYFLEAFGEHAMPNDFLH